MVALLRDELGIPSNRYSFPAAVDCADWGRWPTAVVPPLQENASQTHWWMHTTPCKKTQERHQMATKGGCLRTEFDACRRSAADAVRNCGGVCYTLSVASALRSFLKGPGNRMLLLEDDVCASASLLRSDNLLRNLAERRPAWDMARIGYCFDKRSGHFDSGRCMANLTQASSTTLLPGIGRSFCAHALGVSRKGAEQLLRLAYPVTAYFDDMVRAIALARKHCAL